MGSKRMGRQAEKCLGQDISLKKYFAQKMKVLRNVECTVKR